MSVIFRNFVWSDVPAITAIYRHAVETSVATFDTEAPGETFMADKFGHMLELYEPSKGLKDFYAYVRKAAAGWNGIDPVRRLSV
mgnify:CR=1 FL=1